MSYFPQIVEAIKVANQEFLDEFEVDLAEEDLRVVKVVPHSGDENTAITLSAHGPKTTGQQTYFYNRKDISDITIETPLEFYEEPTVDVALFELSQQVDELPAASEILNISTNVEEDTITFYVRSESLEWTGEVTLPAVFHYEETGFDLNEITGNGILDGFDFEPAEEA